MATATAEMATAASMATSTVSSSTTRERGAGCKRQNAGQNQTDH
jgi:hypothetical protein